MWKNSVQQMWARSMPRSVGLPSAARHAALAGGRTTTLGSLPAGEERKPMQADDLVKLTTLAMPFGKHKGKPIVDLPANYLAWFAREGFPKGEIGRLLALMLEIDHNGLRHLLRPLQRRDGRPGTER
jgi:uncharacterized protein (DUF3820 family)